MTQNADTQTLLYQVRLLLDEGRNDEALSMLQDIRAEDALYKEVTYLTGWCYAQLNQWNLSIQTLHPLVVSLRPPGLKMLSPERERLTLCMLYLGLAAMTRQHYEDASLHLTHCLKVLHDRRVHLPAVRIRTRSSLAQTCAIRGLHTNAIHHYEEALRLCQRYNDQRELPAIYYGLCEAYRYIDDFTRADLAGQEAIRLYHERNDDHMEARALYLLGQVHVAQNNYTVAADYFKRSSLLACQRGDSSIVILNNLSLADLSIAQKHLDEARGYSQKALTSLEDAGGVEDDLRRETYCVVGKVMQQEAQETSGPRRSQLLEDAVLWYERAAQQPAEAWENAHAISVYEDWARALEELGRTEEALKRWHSAYALLSA